MRRDPSWEATESRPTSVASRAVVAVRGTSALNRSEGCAAVSVRSAADPVARAVAMDRNGSPTLMMVPGVAKTASTMPSTGDSNSIAALTVSNVPRTSPSRTREPGAVPYLLAAAAAQRFAPAALGPSEDERGSRESVRRIADGLLAGARHVGDRRPVRDGLAMIGVHRLCYGVTTVCTLLLYRNYFHADGFFRAGLAGLSQVVAAIAVGGGLAALVTPVAYRRLGAISWPVLLLVAAAAVQLGLWLPFRLSLLLPAALLLAFIAQAIKITVDTLVSSTWPTSSAGGCSRSTTPSST